MYNNEITYDDKWNTSENEKALKILERKYFDYSECSPSCPVAWAPEVLELFDKLHKEFGFIRNEGTIRGYFVRGNILEWFITGPANNFVYGLKKYIFSVPTKFDVNGTKYPMSVLGRLAGLFNMTFHSIEYGFRAIKVVRINPILNKLFPGKISLSQLKEKYGDLTIYFSAPEVYSEYIEKEIKKVKIKLALKGAYYPIETLWNSTVSYHIGTDYHLDTLTIKSGTYSTGETYTSVEKTVYRNLMKEMNLNIEEIKNKAAAAVGVANKESKDE